MNSATVVLILLSSAMIDAISFTLNPHQMDCFFEAQPMGTNCAAQFEVLEGGSLDVDLDIYDPSGTKIYSVQRKKRGQASFSVQVDGHYRVCFGNRFSTVTAKVLSIDIDCNTNSAHANAGTAPELQETLDDTTIAIGALSDSLRDVEREQAYQVRRAGRHLITNQSTERRVLFWSILEACLVVLVAAFQVYWLKRLFETRRSL